MAQYFLNLPPKWFLKDLKQVEFALARISQWASNTMIGKINVHGELTLAANSATTTLNDVRLGPESVVLFMPITESAARAIGAVQGMRGVRLTNSTVQIIPNAATTIVTWDTEAFDDDGAHAAGASDILVPTGVGRAKFYAGDTWATAAGGTRVIDIANITTGTVLAKDTRGSGAADQAIGTGPVAVTAGDAIRVRVLQGSGASLTLGTSNTFFSAEWLHGAAGDFYVSSQGSQTLTITHPNTADTDKNFRYAIFA